MNFGRKVFNGLGTGWSQALRLNLSTTGTLGTEESGLWREVETRVMYGMSAKKNGRCREVAVGGGWTAFRKEIIKL